MKKFFMHKYANKIKNLGTFLWIPMVMSTKSEIDIGVMEIFSNQNSQCSNNELISRLSDEHRNCD